MCSQEVCSRTTLWLQSYGHLAWGTRTWRAKPRLQEPEGTVGPGNGGAGGAGQSLGRRHPCCRLAYSKSRTWPLGQHQATRGRRGPSPMAAEGRRVRGIVRLWDVHGYVFLAHVPSH